ncbi:MAG TPA: hypothetical protein PKY59_16680 [Pyrinomonadaceae bacterium]|nr:hypothetical protein [Pyrinomonadaceae bacterium]
MKNFRFIALLSAFLLVFGFTQNSFAQNAKEVYQGTVVSFGNGFDTRVRSANFTLNINGTTSDQDTQRYLDILREGGQDDVLKQVSKQDLGRFSVGANVGIPINFVRETTVDGKRRIFVVFERWTQFAELRGGYRSLDYPFGVIEIFIDPKTGKGEGTYIAAARVSWDKDSKNGQYQVEIENFATYPARLMGVTTAK